MKIFKIFIRSLLTLLLTYVALPYLISPVYNYPDPAPFSGKNYYNPYSDIQSLVPYKGNFHCHSNSWGLLTDGRSENNSPEKILKEYAFYGYDITGISDYMSINPYSSVPEYEHGMGVKKTHQVIIGAESVLWIDFMLPHKTNHKQFILNILKDSNNVVMLSHPSWNNAYQPEDVKNLRNFDCMEILSTNRESVALWDTALSAGRPVFMMMNDDGHNAVNPDVTGRIFNLIYAKDKTTASVIDALKNGRNAGYEIPLSSITVQQKKYHDELVKLNSVNIVNDTLTIVFSDSLKTLRLKGQGGVLLAKKDSVSRIIHPIDEFDSYIRCEAEMYNGTRIFLNPIIKTDQISNAGEPEVNMTRTTILSSFMMLTYIFAIYLFWRPKKRH